MSPRRKNQLSTRERIRRKSHTPKNDYIFVCRRPREKRERSFLSAVGALPDEKEKPWSTHATSGYGCIQQLSVHPNNIGGQQLRIVLSFSDCFLLLEVSVAGWRELSSRGNKSKLRNLLGHGESWLARSRERRCCENEVEKERKKKNRIFLCVGTNTDLAFPARSDNIRTRELSPITKWEFYLWCDYTARPLESFKRMTWRFCLFNKLVPKNDAGFFIGALSNCISL